MKRLTGIALFAVLLFGLIFGFNPLAIWAQATAGYTKVNTAPTTATTFTTGTLANGTVLNFEITAVNAAGESGPSNIITLAIPATGTHMVTLNWIASTGATSYNVYDQQVLIANPPGALSGVVN